MKSIPLNRETDSLLSMRKNLAERIAIMIDELNTTQVGLADLAGVTKAAVNQWLGGKPDSGISAASAFKLEDKTPFCARWISTGDGPMYKAEGQREAALIELYRACDARGKAQVFRAAESESVYAVTKDDCEDAA